jgi:hypothetical protein
MTDLPDDPKKSLNQILNEQNSIIQLFLDQFKFKQSLLTIFNHTSVNISPRFIDASVLFLFLTFIFGINGLLKWDLTTPMITLGIVALFAIIEIIGTNTTFFKKFFDTDKKTRSFLDNLDSMSTNKIEDDINYLNFSSGNMNYLLSIVEQDKNKIPPHIVEKILISQDLTKENLDKIFSPKILNNFREKAIITILFKKLDKLTPENINAVYDTFRDNDQILKVLFATQYDSKYLLKNDGNTQKLNEYFEKYQIKKEQYDIVLKLVPINHFEGIKTGFLLLFWLIFLMGAVVASFSQPYSQNVDIISKLLSILFLPLFASSLIVVIFVLPVLRFFRRHYTNRFLKNVMK